MSTRTRDAILGAIGLAALACYILACGPAFSPDDSKVLFPSNDPRTGHVVMAMYDRRTRTTRPLLALPAEADESPPAYAWTQDGTRAVALWVEDDDVLRIAVVPLKTGRALRLLTIPDFESSQMEYLYWHPCVVGASLFIGGEDTIRRIDLETGAEETAKVDGATRLLALGDRVYYARKLPDEGATTGRAEFGLLDLQALTLAPQFVAAGVGADILAVSRDGARIAVAAEEDDAKQIRILENGRARATLALGGGNDAREIAGMPQWSRDGESLYYTYHEPLDEQHRQYGILELPIDGSAPRLLPLLVAGASDSDSLMPLDVSHDGRTLATVSTYLRTSSGKLAQGKQPNLRPEDLALFLVDLATARRTVTRIPIPPLPEQADAR